MSTSIRVVVVDDSALMRHIITTLLERDPQIRVVGAAADGRAAIDLVQELRPDVVTMDVRMPVMDGLACTERLMASCPTPILVLTASLARHDVNITFKMLGAGALEVIEKPVGSDPQQFERAGQDLIRRVKLLARRKAGAENEVSFGSVAARRAAARPSRDPGSFPRPSFPLIVIGASTGGPRVVYQILEALPPDLPAAVLVVQHIAAGFSAGLADWLATAGPLPLQLAREGQRIQPQLVLVAPDTHNLLITAERTVHLSRSPLLIQQPSIDVTMQAAAEVFGSQAFGVLLTGMGRDGAYGMLAIRRAGGQTIVQDEASSAIFGMPRAAIQLGAAAEVLPAPCIAARLVELATSTLGANRREQARL